MTLRRLGWQIRIISYSIALGVAGLIIFLVRMDRVELEPSETSAVSAGILFGLAVAAALVSIAHIVLSRRSLLTPRESWQGKESAARTIRRLTFSNFILLALAIFLVSLVLLMGAFSLSLTTYIFVGAISIVVGVATLLSWKLWSEVRSWT